MKILVICQYYYPEPFRISDICEEFVKEGHEVTVVTGTPNYPMGKIYAGYENGSRTYEVVNGVNVHRLKTIPRGTGLFQRVENYFSYPVVADKFVKTLPGDFDVVFVNQLSPVMMAKPALKYKKMHGTKVVLYCLDLWPESLLIGGVKRNSPIYRIFGLISKKIYQGVDEILITSKSFARYFRKEFRISPEKICYLPQYAEDQFLSIQSKKQEDIFCVVFAGNIGAAQSLGTVIGAAWKMKNEKVHFHIVGDGVELDSIKKQADGLDNVFFHGRKPVEDMPHYYNMADAMLVTLVKDEAMSLVVPGKVPTYMAAGKAIVGAIDGETSLLLSDAQGGYCGEAENSEELVANILSLMNSGKASEVGRLNRMYYEKNFSKGKFMKKLNEALE